MEEENEVLHSEEQNFDDLVFLKSWKIEHPASMQIILEKSKVGKDDNSKKKGKSLEERVSSESKESGHPSENGVLSGENENQGAMIVQHANSIEELVEKGKTKDATIKRLNKENESLKVEISKLKKSVKKLNKVLCLKKKVPHLLAGVKRSTSEGVRSEVMNIICFGRASSGKTNSLSLLEDTCSTPEETLVIKKTCSGLLIRTISLKDAKGQVKTLRIFDFPEWEKNVSESDVKTMFKEAVSFGMGHLHAVLYFSSCIVGLDVSDVPKVKSIIDVFGPLKVNLACVLTNFELRPEKDKERIILQLKDDRNFSKFMKENKMKILFTGMVHPDRVGYQDVESLTIGYQKVSKMRVKLLQYLFGQTKENDAFLYEKIDMTQLNELNNIGRGSVCTVFRVKQALHSGERVEVALKIFDNKLVQSGAITDAMVIEESRKMLCCDHVNCIKCLGYFLKGRKGIMTELCEESLEDKIENNALGSFKKKVKIIQQIAAGMHYLHAEKRIIHKDLKPDNVLVTKDGVCKLVDFGISEEIAQLKTSLTLKSFAGTPFFFAPEMLGEERYDELCDVFSFGVVCYCLFFEIPKKSIVKMQNLFYGGFSILKGTGQDKIKKLLSDEKWKPKYPKGFKESKCSVREKKFLKMMMSCLQIDPCDRPSFGSIIKLIKRRLTPQEKKKKK